ncbi:hypothetical protein LRS06_07655 [Hymenobacter sp. J193]|uniref:hypothetical protein n=1 Tax=Hymenobacter sp. J193 TaxID=2898429 RepID=UPI002150EFB4|nr:hypothetical protein [Hymenobacter sp. J193]MCR5887654.1 hypothetical protein [Hymenobacter sp. J193]
MNQILRRIGAVTLFAAVCQPAYALGDFIIPQTFGLIVGLPLAIGLFWLVLLATLQGQETTKLQVGRLLLVGLLTTIFNIIYIGLIWVFDSATWSFLEVPNKTKQGAIYLLPTAILIILAVIRRWPYRALVIAVSCLLVWIGYLTMNG